MKPSCELSELSVTVLTPGESRWFPLPKSGLRTLFVNTKELLHQGPSSAGEMLQNIFANCLTAIAAREDAYVSSFSNGLWTRSGLAYQDSDNP